jgi:hypothetical protein
VSVIAGLIGGFGLLILAMVLGFASSRVDHRICLKRPRIWPPLRTLYLSFMLLGGILVLATNITEAMHTVAGLELMAVGYMFIAMTVPLLMGYSHGARPVEPGWWQKVHLDVPPATRPNSKEAAE